MDQAPRFPLRSLLQLLRRLAPAALAGLLAAASAVAVPGQAPSETAQGKPSHHHAPPAHADGGDHPHGQPFECHDRHHDFSDAERWSAIFDSPERQEWQKPAEVVALMEIEPGMTAADLGAGTGYFLGYLAAAVGEEGRVLALEPEENLVDLMRERGEKEGWRNVEARRIPYDDPELDPGSLDRLLIVNTWHHIEDRAAYAAKILAGLKPGGRVYVVDYTKDSPSGPPPEERLEPAQIVDELARGGLVSGLVEETLPRQFIVVGRRDDG